MVKIVEIHKRLCKRFFQAQEKHTPLATALLIYHKCDTKKGGFQKQQLEHLCAQMHRYHMKDFNFTQQVKQNTRMITFYQPMGLVELKAGEFQNKNLDHYTGDFSMKHPESFIHSLQINETEMDDFKLDDLATVQSESESQNQSFMYRMFLIILREDSVLVCDISNASTQGI